MTGSHLFKLPQELWDVISQSLTSLDFPNLVVYGKHLTSDESRYCAIWKRVMKDTDWLDAMTELGLNPMLVGPSLERPKYLYLIVNDLHGDTQYEDGKLLASLRSKSPPQGSEVILEDGTTLNIYDPRYNPLAIPVKPKMLFSGSRPSRLRTKYVYWNDRSRQIRRITSTDIKACRWAKGIALSRPSKKNFECDVTFSDPDHHLPERRPNVISVQAVNHPRPVTE